MRKLLFFLFLVVGVTVGWAQEQEFLQTKIPLRLYLNSDPELTTSAKDILCGSLESKAQNEELLLLEPASRVRVMRRTRFVQRQTIYDRENSTSTTVDRLFKVALVEVADGEAKGRVGWVVVSYRATGEDPVIFLSNI